MKKHSRSIFTLGAFIALFICLTAFTPHASILNSDHPTYMDSNDELKEEAFAILRAKCNVCHRKQNPFMVFNQKNMVKRAKRIYKAVFVDRRMPKGNTVRLSQKEYTTLENWLSIQKFNN